MTIFTEKVAIITGSSRGIGAHMATTLGSLGAKVVVNYSSDQASADNVVATITQAGGDAIAVRADVSQLSDMEILFDTSIKQYGKVDYLVNNAGIAIYKAVADITDEEFDRIFNINVKGVFNALKVASSKLADNGSIVNLSSSVTRLMFPTYAAYSATKAAVEQMTRVFAKEIGPRKINVNSVSPGPTNTELFTQGKTDEVIARLSAMSAFGRIGEPEDITRAVVFLLSDDAQWITAQNLGVNGGFA